MQNWDGAGRGYNIFTCIELYQSIEEIFQASFFFKDVLVQESFAACHQYAMRD